MFLLGSLSDPAFGDRATKTRTRPVPPIDARSHEGLQVAMFAMG
ncbi:MAG: hypothetical protein Kow0056_13360 [Coriobacteriia bacterium]